MPIRDLAFRVGRKIVGLTRRPLAFRGSQTYWDQRYAKGGTSGAGSYGRLARFKADFLNQFVRTHGVRSVIEFGSGDGAQLDLARYPNYFGVDVSPLAVAKCRAKFASDATKQFAIVPQPGTLFDLAISLDVVYHLVEDDVYHLYMLRLFAASNQWVIIYSSNFEQTEPPSAEHVRHRRFTDWVSDNAKTWTLVDHWPNAYPWRPDNLKQGDSTENSFADFYVYRSGT